MNRPSASALLFARQLVSLLSAPAASELLLVTRQSEGIPLSAVSEATLIELERTMPLLLPLDRNRARVAVRPETVRLTLLATLQEPGTAAPENAPALRIRAAIAADRVDEALLEFAEAGGVFFSLVHGLDAARRVVSAFPETVRQGSEILLLADAINAMKAGNVAHAKYLIGERYGVLATGLDHLVRAEAEVSSDFLCCRLVLAVGDEEPLDDDVLSLAFRRLESLPDDASMLRGMLYNVALDGFVRRGRWSTAEETAQRARSHFVNAQAHLSVFYIDLYLARIELARGDLWRTESRLADARESLDRAESRSANDGRLLEALELICAYERGSPGRLAEFLLLHMQDEGFGEIWPSIAGPIIGYGARSLALTVTLASARAFVERWRLQQWRSNRFEASIALADIEALQYYGRWHAAEEALAERRAAGGALPTPQILADTPDGALIETELRACRQRLETAPADPALVQRIDALLANERLMARERIALLVWRAAAAVAARHWSALRTTVLELAELVAATGLTTVLTEQQQALTKLFSDREARRRLSASPKTAFFLREHQRHADPTLEGAARIGLTRQEARILFLLVERVPNKTIARRLGLALPTVRFHLKNLYRKLGCNTRETAVAAASRIGIVTD